MIVESGLPTPVGVEARQAADNENQREAVDLAEQLCQWGQKHAWHTVGAITHRFKFQKDFSKQLTHLAMDAEANGQKVLAGQVSDGLTKILHLCDKIDKICRKGCESDDELDELELAKIHAQRAITHVAELVGKTRTSPRAAKPERRIKTRSPSSELSSKEKHIWAAVHVQGKTIAQAAMECDCTPQNISKHLKQAERKMKAQRSRSIGTSRPLPSDSRGQVVCAD